MQPGCMKLACQNAQPPHGRRPVNRHQDCASFQPGRRRLVARSLIFSARLNETILKFRRLYQSTRTIRPEVFLLSLECRPLYRRLHNSPVETSHPSGIGPNAESTKGRFVAGGGS